MTEPSEYAATSAEISAALDALAEKVEHPNYADETTRDQFKRDIAQALELGQRFLDLLDEVRGEFDTDYSYFKQWCDMMDKKVGRQNG